jgi:hypothetical protein
VSATDAAELSAVCSQTPLTRRTLAILAHMTADGLSGPPIGVIHLLAILLEDRLIPPEEPLLPIFIDTYRRCVHELLRPLAAQHSTSALQDELALLPASTRYRAMGTAIGQWSARLGLHALQPRRALDQYQPVELLAAGEKGFLDDEIIGQLNHRWARFLDKCRASTIAFNRSDLLVVRHYSALNTHAKRYSFARANELAQRLGDRVHPLIKPRIRERGETSTQLPDPSNYPIGGYSGLTNRGSLENLLSSELVYLDKTEAVDWFTVRQLNQELLYYTRDEATSVREDRCIALLFPADLGELREYDEEFQCRRGLAALASIISLVESLPRYLGATNLTLRLIQYGKSRAKFNPSELLQIRFAHTKGIRHEQVATVDEAQLEGSPVVWGEQLSEDAFGIELWGQTPAFIGGHPQPLPGNLRPWVRAQSLLLSSLLE